MSLKDDSHDEPGRRRVLKSLLAFGGALALTRSADADKMSHHHEHMHEMGDGSVRRSVADYAIPTVRQVRQDGVRVTFPREIDDGRAVILGFVYTSCTAICPMTSRVLSQVQERLRDERNRLHIVSISIDPEYDTPQRLAAYAKEFHAGPEWQHYTGTLPASIALQRAFQVYRGDKMNHQAVTLLRAAPGKAWVRLDGLAGPDDIVAAYREVVAS